MISETSSSPDSESLTEEASASHEAGENSASWSNSHGAQYLTFRLADQDFGVAILSVQEIKNYSVITPIPNTPAYVKGAMNLRGTVVPIIDLRVKFEMPEAVYDQHTVIVVVNVGSRILGLIVDAVSDVLNVGEDEFEAAPDFGQDAETGFIIGLAKTNDKLTTLLDLERLIGKTC